MNAHFCEVESKTYLLVSDLIIYLEGVVEEKNPKDELKLAIRDLKNVVSIRSENK